MYNKKLDTFLKVAELGSFSKAAQALYITPSAVIQQINALESELESCLFRRTPKGVILTPAGSLLQREAVGLVEQCAALRNELRELDRRQQKEIRVGVTLLYQCRAFYQLWNRFSADRPELQVVIRNLNVGGAKEVDLIETVNFSRELPNGMEFLELTRVPLVCALWREHPLAQKERLSYEDIQGQTLVTVDSPYFVSQLHELRREAQEHDVDALAVESYDLSVFSMCAAKGYLLQIPLYWKDINPHLISIPFEWEYTLPYGFFYRVSSPSARDFVEFVKQEKQKYEIQITL